MRLAALLAIAVGCAGATSAVAQSLAPGLLTPDITALNAAAFAPKAAVWQSSAVRLSGPKTHSVDTLQVTVGGQPFAFQPDAVKADRFDVTVVRRWPKAVQFDSEGLAFDVSPHAGFGVNNFGGQAVGGATLTVSKSRGEQAMERLRDLGVQDGATYGDAGRFYFFAAASGRAVGLNMMRGEQGWDRAGWSTDMTSGLVGDAQVGVGWRKGVVQSSVGVVHREVKGKHMVFGQTTRDDTVAAFTLSIRPGN